MIEPEGPASPARVCAWRELSVHLLDTETRHLLPLTALSTLEAGATLELLEDAWLHEVLPALAPEQLTGLGEWAGWDEAWLLDTLGRQRQERSRWGNRVRRFTRRAHPWHGTWEALARCRGALERTAAGDERTSLATALAFLARHWFDFRAEPLSSLDGPSLTRVRGVAAGRLAECLSPANVDARERRESEARVRSLLG